MKKLASIIINTLKKGLQADDHLFAQAESLLGASTPDQLQQALASPDIAEGRVLMDLLFSPGEDLLFGMEEHLPKKSLSAGYVQKLMQEVLSALPILARIACQQTAFFLEVPAFGARRFVKGLKLDADLGGQIPQFLQKQKKKQALSVRCLVRQAGIAWTRDFEDFFLAFLKQADWHDSNFMPLVRKALELIAQAPQNTPLGPYLEGIIRWCRLHLDQARQTREDLAGTNMEMRMGLGIRPAFVDENRLGQTLRAAERIYNLVFGPLLPEGPFRTLEQAVDPCDPQDIRLAVRALLKDEG